MGILFTGKWGYRARVFHISVADLKSAPQAPHAHLCLTQGQGCSLPRLESEAALHKRTPPRELLPAEVLVEVFPNPRFNGLSLADELYSTITIRQSQAAFRKCTARPALFQSRR
jgi:hypothetical protein